MKINKKSSGFLLASAAAALFMHGPVMAEEPGGAQEAKVHCGGINACKGQAECKTANNACACWRLTPFFFLDKSGGY